MKAGSIAERVGIRRAYELATGRDVDGAVDKKHARVRCPVDTHEDQHPSCDLDLTANIWTCRTCSAGGGVFDLVTAAKKASDHEGAARWLEKVVDGRRVIESFIYEGFEGKPLARIDRIEPGLDGRAKDFLPYRALPGGGFDDRPGLRGLRLPLFRVDEVRAVIDAGGDVYLVEGEGKANRLREAINEAGWCAAATTIAFGAKSRLSDEHVASFSGARCVFVCADSDPPGRDAAEKRAECLRAACPECNVQVLDLFPEESDGSDVADWLAGHTLDEMRTLADAAATPPEPADTPSAAHDGGTREKAAHRGNNAPRNVPTQANVNKDAQAKRLLDILAQAHVEYVHDASGIPYAVLPGNAPRLYPVRAGLFRSLLAQFYFDRFGTVPGGSALSDARCVMEGLAVHKGGCVEVYLRYANVDGGIEVDLGSEAREIVRVTSTGWEVVKEHQRLWRRPPGMLALPCPVRGGSIDELHSFFNMDEDNFVRLLIVVVNAMRGSGPFPIGVFAGPQGSAKTTSARMVKALIDPSKPDVRAECSDVRDLAIAAANAYCIVLDNISTISPRIADALCRTSTGGGYGTRQLYTDDDEKLFDYQRPVILTAIVDLLARPDLADRAMLVRFSPIDEGKRKDERRLFQAFEAARPRLFGVLLGALVGALANLAEVERSTRNAQRMADAHLWSVAAEPELGVKVGSVHKAWTGTHADAVASALEGSAIAEPLLALLAENVSDDRPWEVTASTLLDALDGQVSETLKRQRGWPKSPQWAGERVDRIVPALRALGYTHTRLDRTAKLRLHVFAKMKPDTPPDDQRRTRVEQLRDGVIGVTASQNSRTQGLSDDATDDAIDERGCGIIDGVIEKSPSNKADHDGDDAIGGNDAILGKPLTRRDGAGVVVSTVTPDSKFCVRCKTLGRARHVANEGHVCIGCLPL